MKNLKNIDVYFISIVDKGANNKTIIYKSASPGVDQNLNKEFSIKKFDDEKGIVYGIVYSPGEVDSQGDVATADEIEKAAYNFLKNLRNRNIDKQHNQVADEGYVGESWITKENDSLFPDDPVGSWAVGIKITNEKTKEGIRKGELSGLSMAGYALREDVSKSLWQSIREKLNFGKSFSGQMSETKSRRITYDLLDAFSGSVHEIFSEEFAGDKKSALLSSIDEMKKYVEDKFDVDFGTVEKVGKVISAKNERTIREAIKALDGVLQLNIKLNKSEVEDMSKEEIQKMISDAMAEVKTLITGIGDSVKVVGDKVAALEGVSKEYGEKIKGFEKSVGSAQVSGQEVKTDEPGAVEKSKDKPVRMF